MKEPKETIIGKATDERSINIYTSETKYINKLKKLAEQYPTEVKMIRQYKEEGKVIDVDYHVPLAWFVFPRPSKRKSMSEEQRQQAAERLKKYREQQQ